ncbi:MAG: AMP-binding enzyme [Microgenomates bacterium OLB23]|nr:MAG: AMP-binding enzyme [Microgenomates bacterium OLB23]
MTQEKILQKYFHHTHKPPRPLQLFHEAARYIPAYKDFLKTHKVSPAKIITMKDFLSVPVMTKENYIHAYDYKSRSWNRKTKTEHMVSTSSGTTGEPVYWPRDIQTVVEGAMYHEKIFNACFDAKKKQTLFINGFALGNWIAGTFTSECCFLVSMKGYPLTTVTPGYNSGEIIRMLKELSPKYEMTIIAGHAPFLKQLIEEAVAAGIDFKKLDVRLLGTGQAITENWRTYVMKLLKSKDREHTVVNLYGSADAALMAFESPESISLRTYYATHPQKTRAQFNDERLPSIYSYDPSIVYFEDVKGELCISKYSSVPLIRYNMHDSGGLLNKHMVYLFGREKFMVKIYGANVYTEHVQHALTHAKLQPYLTSSFKLEMAYDADNNPQLICRVELTMTTQKSDELVEQVQNIFY